MLLFLLFAVERLIANAAEARSVEEAGTITYVEQGSEAATLVRFVRRLVDLVRDAGIIDKQLFLGADAFDAWLTYARDSNVIVTERLEAEPTLASASPHGRAVKRDLTRAHLIVERARKISQPGSGKHRSSLSPSPVEDMKRHSRVWRCFAPRFGQLIKPRCFPRADMPIAQPLRDANQQADGRLI